MSQESLDDTQRRLGLGRHVKVPRPGRAIAAVFVVVGILVVGALVAVNLFQTPPSAPSAEADDDACVDDFVNDSLESAQARADEVARELRSEFGNVGFRWTLVSPASVSVAADDYDDSWTLHDFEGDVYVGEVLSRSDNFDQIFNSFDQVMSQHGWSSRAATGQGALWSAESDDMGATGLEFTVEAYYADPVDASAPSWVPDNPIGTFFVRVTASGDDLLTQADRDEVVSVLTSGGVELKCVD